LTKVAAVLAVLVLAGPSLASQPAGFQPLRIVDFPTAGLYDRGEYGIDLDVYSDGGLLVGMGVGFAGFLSFGITYGGVGFIGSGDLDMNPRPEVNLRARVYNEGLVMPAIALGFDSQGYGKFMDKQERYLAKSRGFYAVASKNWDLAGPLSLHGGLSYSLENKTDHDPTIFLGLIKSFAGVVELAAEFDLAANDNQGPASLAEKRGYFNASIAWCLREKFSLALDVRDIATTGKAGAGSARKWNRGLSISYRARL
jgi:hypothetical protein